MNDEIEEEMIVKPSKKSSKNDDLEESEFSLKTINKIVKSGGVFQTLDTMPDEERFRCQIDLVNIALSGNPRKGILRKGITVLAGDSGSYKTSLALLMAKSFLLHNPTGKIVFFDSEGGSPKNFFITNKINPKDVIVNKFTQIEELSQIVLQFSQGLKDSKIPYFFIVDSLSFASTKKAITDLIDGNDKEDMTKAKKVNSFVCNSLRPLDEYNIPMVLIAHTYTEQKMFGKEVVKGGKGLTYSANDILIMSRSKNQKTGDLFEGAVDFRLKVNKSRTVKREISFKLTLTEDGELLKFAGLFEIAVELGIFEQIGTKYVIPNDDTYGKFNERSTIMDKEFWKYVYDNTDFIKRCEEEYVIGFKPFSYDEEFI